MDVPEPARSELREIYCELRETYGPFTRLARRWAKQAAEAWRVVDVVSEEAAVLAAARQRKQGRPGRRPKRSQVTTAAKRQSLELDTLDRIALPRLEKFAGRNGHGPAAALAAFRQTWVTPVRPAVDPGEAGDA